MYIIHKRVWVEHHDSCVDEHHTKNHYNIGVTVAGHISLGQQHSKARKHSVPIALMPWLLFGPA